MIEEQIEYVFNYASISLKPYAKDSGTSNQLLKNIFLKLSEKDFPPEDRIKDRNENQANSPKRKLVIIANRFEEKGQRYFGKIALIKNKSPLLLQGNDIIEEIEKKENSKFIEITNFSINFNSATDPVIMHEFNHEGPRLSDIIYYIRQIAAKFRIGKNISFNLHLDTNYEQLDSQIANVFNVKIKTNVLNNIKIDWLKSLKTLHDDSGYRDVKMELYYKRKEVNGKYEKNINGTKFARNIIGWLKKDSNNLEYLDDLKMAYQVDNSEEIIDLDFLKNKVVSLLKLKRTDVNNVNFKFIVGQEFNKYLSTGKTTIQD